MAVAMLIDNPNGSQKIYERLRARMGLDGPAGGILHVAGRSPNGGWRVIEIWESEEDAKRFLAERTARRPASDRQVSGPQTLAPGRTRQLRRSDGQAPASRYARAKPRQAATSSSLDRLAVSFAEPSGSGARWVKLSFSSLIGARPSSS